MIKCAQNQMAQKVSSVVKCLKVPKLSYVMHTTLAINAPPS